MSKTTGQTGQCGYTLIELMVAMSLGLFIIGGGIGIFIATQQSNRMQENLSRLQETARFAMDFIERDMRMTGFWGCKAATTPDADVAGTDGASGAADTLTLRGAFAPSAADAAAIYTTCTSPVLSTDTVYTDTKARIVYSITSSTLNRATGGSTAAVADGVDNMQILYGADTDADGVANYYVPATNITNMANVISLRITLLVSTLDDNLLAQSTSYTYNGITTTDRKIHKLFTSTIAIRNRQS